MARSGPGTGTDRLPKMAARSRNRATVASFSRPWRLRRLLSTGRSAQQMRWNGYRRCGLC